jgi:hypothetical protein
MRISTQASLFLLGALGALGAPAHADRKDDVHTGSSVASLGPPRADRPERSAGADPSTENVPLTGPARPARAEPFLTSGEISRNVAPHAPQIERCYLEQLGAGRQGGRLELTLVIARDGSVRSLKAAASGLPAKTVRKVEACIREIVETVQFPARRNDTTAVVPYMFQKTDVPNAGPLESCWNSRGC